MTGLGFVILGLGVSMADSENLLIPLITVSIGLWIMWRYKDAE